jgi:hypothetical protein
MTLARRTIEAAAATGARPVYRWNDTRYVRAK